MRITLAMVVFGVIAAAGPSSAQTALARLQGRVTDTSNLPLPGVTVLLTREARAPVVTHTDEVGRYIFNVPSGRYTLTAELSGFETVVRPNLAIGGDPVVLDLVMPLGAIQMETQVVAQVPRVMTAAEPTAPATVDKEIIKMAPVHGIRYDSALPLLPSAIRGPDGLISIGGARAWQGTVLADSMRETDPLTGEPHLALPITAIDNVLVYSPAPPAEMGPGSGGITQVVTKAASDSFFFNILGLVPRPRFTGSRGTTGFESWNPTIGISGPIVKGRVWLAQSVEYRWERFQFETVAGKQDSSVRGWTSFTRLDIKPKGPHLITARLAVTPEETRNFGLDAFAPSSSVPNLQRGGISVGLVDRMALGPTGTLELRLHVRHYTLELEPTGREPYSIGHDQVRGSYYLTKDREALRTEGSATWSRPFTGFHGDHLVKAGVRLAHVAASGTATANPVDYLRSDGTRARRFEFFGTGLFETSVGEGGLFVQDSWTLRRGLRVDTGVRLDVRSAVSSFVVLPRMTWTYDLKPNRTKVSGSVGLYVDKPLLQPAVFDQRQSRREQLFDLQGVPAGPACEYTNHVEGVLRPPRAAIWSLQIDHALSAGWMVRAAYQERLGRREFVVRPTRETETVGALTLSGDGESHARSVEATAGYRSPGGSHQVYVSYVRAMTEGNLNDLNRVAGNFERALVLPDARAPLATDVPHRFVAWGILSMPWRLTVSPFVEVRSGFPFTRIDEDWNVVGTRNDARFPLFVSVDVAVEKAVTLPFGLPARLGLKFFNVAGRNNGRSIQRNVARPDFGQTYDPIPRQLRGTLEIAWSKG